MSFKTKLISIAVVGLVSTFNASAGLVTSFNGTYDEDTGVESAGDFDNIGGFNDVGSFALVGGVNTFLGSISTPSDSADVFNIVIGANQTLTGASLVFAENADAFNPYFGFPSPTWGLFESSTTPTIFEFKVPDTGNSGRTSPVTNTQVFTRGEGVYNFLFGNGTFGLNNGGGVDYTVTFNVTETSVEPPAPPVSEVSAPTSLALFGGMLMLAFGVKRASIKKQKSTH